ncbi:MAG: NADH-quinone oxidoreductase subunit [Pseudonocardia sp.]|jgi:NADH-quinone oxidoreductase subunit A|nr:NADH-quinone oxidoreductase subunit [Pseudonocardia sp.]
MDEYLRSYALVGLLLMLGVGFVAVSYGANRLLRPNRPTREKVLGYERGLNPVGDGWAQSHVRYYVIAFLYLIFAVDAVFLFPWATDFARPGYGAVTLVEMFVFLGFVAAGVGYAWRKGRFVLNWGRRYSLWVLNFGLASCAIEFIAASMNGILQLQKKIAGQPLGDVLRLEPGW